MTNDKNGLSGCGGNIWRDWTRTQANAEFINWKAMSFCGFTGVLKW